MSSISDGAEADPGHGVDFMLGLFLVASPHLLHRADDPAIAWNAWILGSLIAMVDLLDLLGPFGWKVYVNLAAGVWIALSPWTFGFAGVPSALWLDVVIGLALVALSGFELWSLRESAGPPVGPRRA